LVGRQPNVLERLSDRQREIVVGCAQRRIFRRNETVFAQGQPHHAVFLLEAGIVRTYYTAPTGKEITLAYWQKGNLVGTPLVLGQGLYQWSGVAIAPTEALVFKGSTLRALIEQIPELALGLIEALEFKGRWFSAIVQMLGTMNVSERLCHLLRSLGDLYGIPGEDGIMLAAPFTHEVVAGMVGASRQWVTTELHTLQKRGAIRVGRRSIVIVKPELLTRSA
jgi:CRP-like cAMP-binding protein